jgi:hypothetical protein
MAGKKGRSGGRRDGAGRRYESITLRLGDQFYVPMHGLAEVVYINANQFKVQLDDERMAFTARSRRKSKADPITVRAIELWADVPAAEIGRMPHSYNIRSVLYREFSDEPRVHVSNCALQAIRMVKHNLRARANE